MENLPKNINESGINRIVGFGDETEGELLGYFKGKFENNTTETKEIDKSPELENIINIINSRMTEFLKTYGIDAVRVPSKNIHILDKSKFSEADFKKLKEKIETNSGYYTSTQQAIVIFKDYSDGNKLSFLQTLVHEMMHLQSFYSFQKSSGRVDLSLTNGDKVANMNIRRSGFSIGTVDGKELIFHKLNESVIEELSIRFEKLYLNNLQEIKSELQMRDSFISYITEHEGADSAKIADVANVNIDKSIDSDGSNWVSHTYGYHDDRKNFNLFIDELYQKNKIDFNSREGVFSFFAKATLNGRILGVARLIEKTFGKGSFRAIGIETKDTRPWASS